MARAIWQGCVLAESEDTIDSDGITYFPVEAINPALLRPTSKRRVRPSLGASTSFDLEYDGHIVTDVAWLLTDASDDKQALSNRVAFYSGVDVVNA